MGEVTSPVEFDKLNETWILKREKSVTQSFIPSKKKNLKKGPNIVQVNSRVNIMLGVGKKPKHEEKRAFPKAESIALYSHLAVHIPDYMKSTGTFEIHCDF